MMMMMMMMMMIIIIIIIIIIAVFVSNIHREQLTRCSSIYFCCSCRYSDITI